MPSWLIDILKSAPELASVVIVVYFALKMNAEYRKSSALVMDEWRGFLNDQNQKWREFIAVEDDKWIIFAKQQTDRFCETVESFEKAVDKIADEVKENSMRISENHALLLAGRGNTQDRSRA